MAHGLRMPSIMARKARQQACEAAGHVLPALGKQRDERSAWLSHSKWGFPPQLTSLETPTPTPTELCLPGDSKSSLADSEDDHHTSGGEGLSRRKATADNQQRTKDAHWPWHWFCQEWGRKRGALLTRGGLQRGRKPSQHRHSLRAPLCRAVGTPSFCSLEGSVRTSPSTLRDSNERHRVHLLMAMAWEGRKTGGQVGLTSVKMRVLGR